MCSVHIKTHYQQNLIGLSSTDPLFFSLFHHSSLYLFNLLLFFFLPCLHAFLSFLPFLFFQTHSTSLFYVSGAINAMQDATILANCLYDLEDLSPESILKTFSDYRNQRYTHAKKQVANSQLNAKISSGQVQAKCSLFSFCL